MKIPVYQAFTAEYLHSSQDKHLAAFLCPKGEVYGMLYNEGVYKGHLQRQRFLFCRKSEFPAIRP